MMGFKVLVIPVLEAHGLPLTQQRENFREKQFWRSREGCETIELICWGNIPNTVNIRGCSTGLDLKQHSQASSAKSGVADVQGWLMWILCSVIDALCE